MTKWEYMEKENLSIDMLNFYGESGWELCGIYSSFNRIFIFKRQVTKPIDPIDRGSTNCGYGQYYQ
jgi:hypothetical protein